MKKTLFAVAIALALALGAAAPAAAQDYRGYRTAHFDHPYVEASLRQLSQIRYQLHDGVRSGAIRRGEAERMMSRIRYVEDLRNLYIRSRGMSEWEAGSLQEQVRSLRLGLRDAMSGRRGNGRGWDDRDSDFDHQDDPYYEG